MKLSRSDAGGAEHESRVPRAVSVLGMVALFLLLLFAGQTIGSSIDPALTDARADWLAANAAAGGIDPWVDLRSLADQLDTTYRVIGIYELGEVERIHPRTPGALLLMWPLTLVTADVVYPLMIFVASLLWVLTALLVVRKFEWAQSFPVIAGSALLVGSAAYLGTLKFGTQSTLLLILTAITWSLNRERDSVGGGVALGLLMTLRLFPGLLLIPFWMFGKRKSVLTAVTTVTFFNLAGLWIYSLNPSEAVTALGVAGRNWAAFSGNGSLLMPLARLGLDIQWSGALLVAAAVAVSVFLPYQRITFDLAVAVVLIVALISSPLSWEHYDVIAFLVAGYVLWGSSTNEGTGRLPRAIVLFWLALQLISPHFVHVVFGERSFTFAGPISLIGRGLLLVALLVLFVTPKPGDSTTSASTQAGTAGYGRDPVEVSGHQT